MNEPQQYATVKDDFDKIVGTLTGLQDVLKTAPTTIQVETPFLGNVEQFTIQTWRPEDGDVLLLTHVKGGQAGAQANRLVIPAKVIDTIIRQREALTTRGRKLRGKQAANARKAAGQPWGFEGKGKRAPKKGK